MAQGVFISDDFVLKKIELPMVYYEGTNLGGAGLPIAAVKAQLLTAGTQNLTFDNATQIPARLASFGKPVFVSGRNFPPWLWQTTLSFVCPTPIAQDIASTTPVGSPFAISGNTSGSVTNFNITYAGAFRTQPTYTLTIPVGNGVPIVSFVLANTMSGEALTIIFPGNLAASTAYTITINSQAFTVVDGGGNAYDFSGSFPNVYGPPTQVNTMRGTLTTASGTSTGVTLGVSFFNSWEM
jgi:hypothetical protein